MRRDRNQLRNVILAGVCTPRINGVTCRLPETWFAATFVVKSIRISFADDDEIFLAVDLRSGKDRGSLGRITGSHRLRVVGWCQGTVGAVDALHLGGVKVRSALASSSSGL